MARGKHEAAKKSEKTKPEKKPKRSGGAKKAVLIIAVVCVLLAAAALGGGYLAGHSDKIHPGMTLGGVSIGDMTVSEATAALEKAGCDFAGGSVEVTLPGDFEFAVSAEQAGMAMSCAQAAQAAFDYGHSGNVFGDLVCYFKSITGSVSDAEILASASTDGVRAAVDKALADYNEHMGKGYEVNEESQTLKMIKGLSTKDIDADKLCQSIIKAFSDGSAPLNTRPPAKTPKRRTLTSCTRRYAPRCLTQNTTPKRRRLPRAAPALSLTRKRLGSFGIRPKTAQR